MSDDNVRVLDLRYFKDDRVFENCTVVTDKRYGTYILSEGKLYQKTNFNGIVCGLVATAYVKKYVNIRHMWGSEKLRIFKRLGLVTKKELSICIRREKAGFSASLLATAKRDIEEITKKYGIRLTITQENAIRLKLSKLGTAELKARRCQ